MPMTAHDLVRIDLWVTQTGRAAVRWVCSCGERGGRIIPEDDRAAKWRPTRAHRIHAAKAARRPSIPVLAPGPHIEEHW